MGESLEARLKRLRKDGISAAPSRTECELPESLKSRLTRSDAFPTVPELRPPTEGMPLDLVEDEGQFGGYATRITERRTGDKHGDWRLDEIAAADSAVIARLTGDAALADLDLSRAVFLDTETTGLSGGAGVYVYMIGLGRFVGDRFEVWQGFLREPGEERALLFEAARRIADADALVSFFGKSFDRHRLEDKMRIAGVEPPFEGLPHLDLYHPFQRLTKGHYENGRLCTMESQLCGLEREDDLPGSLAPAAWFDFLAERPHRLEGVFAHNLDDVLSLVTLAAYLGRAEHGRRADGSALVGPERGRMRAMARAYIESGDRATGLAWIEKALEYERAAGEAPRDLAYARGETLRLMGETSGARRALEELAAGQEDEFSAPTWIALAKLLEHRAHDLVAAREACLRARELLRRPFDVRGGARLSRELEARLVRLAAKLAKASQA